jgi:uncharacterized iron-regulated protein
MRHTRLMAAAALLATAAAAQTPRQDAPPPALRIYDSAGRASSLEEIVGAMAGADVVFVGETHNDPAAHWAELRLLAGAHARHGRAADAANRRPLVLSLEMFERDAQVALDEYLAGLVTERHFLAAARPWKNYETDYRPLVEFARAHRLPVVAANAPERYVNRVGRLGPDSLAALGTEAKRWLAPLPYARASAPYAEKFRRVMGAHAAAAPHGNPFSLDAQALRDATMAHSIAEQLRARERALVLHVNGNFHSEGGLGVPEHLRAYRPGARALVVTVLPPGAAAPADASGFKALGDFVIATGANSPPTRTF